jgi:hypothetical protein
VDLIRGDLLTLVATVGGETFQWQVEIDEYSILDKCPGADDCQYITKEHRALRVTDPEEETAIPNLSLFYHFYAGEDEGEKQILRSGEHLDWPDEGVSAQDYWFMIGIEEEGPENGVLEDVTLTWESLVRWNQGSFLRLDPSTGGFRMEFQVYDPRFTPPDQCGGPSEGEDDTGGDPFYEFIAGACDVPDQKDEPIGRCDDLPIGMLFQPEDLDCPVREGLRPAIEVTNIDEELINGQDVCDVELGVCVAQSTLECETDADCQAVWTEASVQLIVGNTESPAGEIKAFRFVLSPDVCDVEGGLCVAQPTRVCISDEDCREGEPLTLLYSPNNFSTLLNGDFAANIQMISDWNENGIIDTTETGGLGGSITNRVEIMAVDVFGNESEQTSIEFSFTPADSEDASPDLQLIETDPELDIGNTAEVTPDREFRARGGASDDKGQPAVFLRACTCSEGWAGEDVNDERCQGCTACIYGVDACDVGTGFCVNKPESPCEADEDCRKDVDCPPEERLPLDATGRFPEEPWVWQSFLDQGLIASPGEYYVDLLRAVERHEQGKKPKFSAIEIRPSFEEGELVPNEIFVSPQVQQGPFVDLSITVRDEAQDGSFFTIDKGVCAVGSGVCDRDPCLAEGVCNNDPTVACDSDADCWRCMNNEDSTCETDSDCDFCVNQPQEACAMDSDCTDTLVIDAEIVENIAQLNQVVTSSTVCEGMESPELTTVVCDLESACESERCTHDPDLTCETDSDCHACVNQPSRSCVSDADCGSDPRGETWRLSWNLEADMFVEGDRICVGAESVTGQATLFLLEFADASEQLLVVKTEASEAAMVRCSPYPFPRACGQE